MCDTGEPPLDKADVCRKFHAQKAKHRRESANRFGVPLIFTEFGACFDGEKCATEINNAVDAFDDYLISWTYWMYKSFGDHTTSGGTKEGLFNDDGTPQALKVKALSRTYAHAFQGTPIKMYFNTADASFTTTFAADASIKAPTEIYMHFDIHYPNGYTATASVDGQ